RAPGPAALLTLSWLMPNFSLSLSLSGARRLAGVIAAGLAASIAGPAWAHCGDDCADPLPLFISPASPVVAADGVLFLDVPRGRAAAALEFFHIKVLDAGADEVAGTLELHEEFSAYTWRPTQPWSVGET